MLALTPSVKLFGLALSSQSMGSRDFRRPLASNPSVKWALGHGFLHGLGPARAPARFMFFEPSMWPYHLLLVHALAQFKDGGPIRPSHNSLLLSHVPCHVGWHTLEQSWELRAVPHSRQLPRTVGSDWPRGSQGYPTGGSSAPLWLTWLGSTPVPSSRGGRLELGSPPNAGPLPSAPAFGRCQQGPVSRPQRAPLHFPAGSFSEPLLFVNAPTQPKTQSSWSLLKPGTYCSAPPWAH